MNCLLRLLLLRPAIFYLGGCHVVTAVSRGCAFPLRFSSLSTQLLHQKLTLHSLYFLTSTNLFQLGVRTPALLTSVNSATTASFIVAMESASESECEVVETLSPPLAIDADVVTTTSLQVLQSADQRKVMDIVDKL